MNYIEVFNKHAIISKLPLRVGDRELRSCTKAKLFLLRVQYSNVIEAFEKEMQDVLKEIKKDYPEFDSQASEIQKMYSINAKLKEYDEYDGEESKRPEKPSDEDLKFAKEASKKEPEFKELNDKLTKEYIEARNQRLQDKAEFKEKKFTEAEFAEIIEVIGDSDIEMEEGKNIKSEDFLSIVATLFID